MSVHHATDQHCHRLDPLSGLLQATRVITAAEQNMWLSSEKVLQRDWLPALHDWGVLQPWDVALRYVVQNLHLGDIQIPTVRPIRISILGGIGWHAVRAVELLTKADGLRDVLPCGSEVALAVEVESVLHDRLTLALAQSVIAHWQRLTVLPEAKNGGAVQPAGDTAASAPLSRPKPGTISRVDLSASLFPAWSGSKGNEVCSDDTVEIAMLEAVAQRATEAWVAESLMGRESFEPTVPLAAERSSDPHLTASPSPSASGGISVLLCVDACSSRLSLQQLASQLWQVSNQT